MTIGTCGTCDTPEEKLFSLFDGDSETLCSSCQSDAEIEYQEQSDSAWHNEDW